MSNFPLYDNISKDVKNKDLTAKQKSELIKKIAKMDDNGTMILYALIKTFSLNDGTVFSLLPYNGERCNPSGVKFDLERFPYKLKQILYKFSDLHDKSKIDE